MKTQATRLAAVAVMAIGLVLGGAVESAAAATNMLSKYDSHGADDVTDDERARVTSLITDPDGNSRYGYMVGQHFVGFLPE